MGRNSSAILRYSSAILRNSSAILKSSSLGKKNVQKSFLIVFFNHFGFQNCSRVAQNCNIHRTVRKWLDMITTPLSFSSFQFSFAAFLEVSVVRLGFG